METREYFRIEATELIARMTADLRTLSHSVASPDAPQWRELRRAAHTLKGAARVVREAEIAAVAHALEDLLVALNVSESMRVVDRLDAMLEKAFATKHASAATPATAVTTKETSPLDSVIPSPSASVEVDSMLQEEAETEEGREERTETIRVELQATDRILSTLAECHAALGAMSALADRLEAQQELISLATMRLRNGAHARALESLLEAGSGLQLLRTTAADQLHELTHMLSDADRMVGELRLERAQQMLVRVERAVRNTAEEFGMQVECFLVGGDERIDLHLLAEAEEAMLHMVRNAVTHGLQGITMPKIRIGVHRIGNMLEFYCSDNGHGVDTERLRSKAVAHQWMTPEEARAASHHQLLQMLSRPGVTTYDRLDGVAGRGIGLDVVRGKARTLRGQLEIASAREEGTRVMLRLPEDLFSIHCLLLEIASYEFAIPIAAIEQTIASVEHRSDTGHFAETMAEMPQRHIDSARLLGIAPLPSGTRAKVIVRSAVGRVLLEVDRIVGMEELVTQTVAENWGVMPWVAGLYRDVKGEPRLLINPLLIRETELLSLTAGNALDGVRLPILVIDDSLTSRMLQESILTSAGYLVETAHSAEEALAMAKQRDYSMYLVDVEMPGMDGFGFVEVTRADARMGQVPVVMVTSRNLPGDRERGLQLGASEYIVKGDFDQGRLLTTVALLTSVQDALKS